MLRLYVTPHCLLPLYVALVFHQQESTLAASGRDYSATMKYLIADVAERFE